MRTIPSYNVPLEVWESEEKKEPLKLNFNPDSWRKKKKDYHKAFRTMIQLEEAAQTLFMRTFDQTDVRIFYTGIGRLFFFLNEVNKSD